MNVLSSEVSIKYSDIDDALYGDMYSDTEDELAEEATKIVVAILFLLDSVRYRIISNQSRIFISVVWDETPLRII
jgi:hypothetical protein